MGIPVNRDFAVTPGSAQKTWQYTTHSKLSTVDPKYNAVLPVWVAITNPAYNITLWPSCLGLHLIRVPPDSHLWLQWCFLRVLLVEEERKAGRKKRSSDRVCTVGLSSPLFPGSSECGGTGSNFSLAHSFPFSTESSLKPVRLPTRQNPLMPCHCVALVTLELGPPVLDKGWGWVDRGAIWDCRCHCRWPAAAVEPSPAAFCQEWQSQPACLAAGSWLVWGDEDWQIRETGTEEAISRNTASRKSVIRMPKGSCISFIAGQTEQPGVEGPLEDNIP